MAGDPEKGPPGIDLVASRVSDTGRSGRAGHSSHTRANQHQRDRNFREPGRHPVPRIAQLGSRWQPRGIEK